MKILILALTVIIGANGVLMAQDAREIPSVKEQLGPVDMSLFQFSQHSLSILPYDFVEIDIEPLKKDEKIHLIFSGKVSLNDAKSVTRECIAYGLKCSYKLKQRILSPGQRAFNAAEMKVTVALFDGTGELVSRDDIGGTSDLPSIQGTDAFYHNNPGEKLYLRAFFSGGHSRLDCSDNEELRKRTQKKDTGYVWCSRGVAELLIIRTGSDTNVSKVYQAKEEWEKSFKRAAKVE